MIRESRRVYIAIPAAVVGAARTWMSNNGYGDENFLREIIRTTDPDNQAPRFYGCSIILQGSDYAKVKNRVDNTTNAVMVDAGRFDARTTVDEFLASKGFRFKPGG